MNGLLISIGSLVAGIIATVLVSKYYFRRSVEKSLTSYIQFSSSPLKGIDPAVRKELEVKYQDHAIDNLYEIQFLIANTGDRAIRDVIKPLTLIIPEKCTLLDASVLHVDPQGRTIDIEISNDKKELRYVFPLLNSGEFFITKLLLNGTPAEEDFRFSIVSDELPPTLAPVPLPYDSIGTSRKREFQYPLLIVGLLITALGLAIVKLIYDVWSSLPSWSELGAWGFFTSLGLSGWVLFVSIVPAFVFLLLGVMITVASFTEGSFPPPKKKFILPDDKQLLRRGIRHPREIKNIE